MKTTLVITDLTRMHHGNVCVSGYDRQRRSIRPVLPRPKGISERLLFVDGKPVIHSFAVIECDLHEPVPQPPHTEDHLFDPDSVRWVKHLEEEKREQVLEWSLFDSVDALFERPIHNDMGCYIMDGDGPRSIGSIRPKAIGRVEYGPGPQGTWDYRVLFKDHADKWYRLKVVDLTWLYYCASLRGEDTQPAQIAEQLTRLLRRRRTWLRIGLTRGWKEYPDRCFLQITAIHTFPDYLEGKVFADFIPPSPF